MPLPVFIQDSNPDYTKLMSRPTPTLYPGVVRTSNCLFQSHVDRERSVGVTASVDPAANVAPQLQKHRTSASVRQRRKSARVLKDPASEGHTHPPLITSCFSVLTYVRAYMVEQRRKLD
uniref:Uncharacterized protein n=1 Tax=Timema tahoe TaxID=61484 RepID=A0A7R9IKA9_9NEOP|nr:unnamed protein product [Timema tahoe]